MARGRLTQRQPFYYSVRFLHSFWEICFFGIVGSLFWLRDVFNLRNNVVFVLPSVVSQRRSNGKCLTFVEDNSPVNNDFVIQLLFNGKTMRVRDDNAQSRIIGDKNPLQKIFHAQADD